MNLSLTASCLTRLLLPWQTLAHVSHEALSGAPPGSPPGFLRAAPTRPCSDSLGALWLSPPHGWDTVVPCVSTALSPLRVGTDLGSCPCPQHECSSRPWMPRTCLNSDRMGERSREEQKSVSLHSLVEAKTLLSGGACGQGVTPDVNDGALLPTCGHGRGERQVARGFWLPPE